LTLHRRGRLQKPVIMHRARMRDETKLFLKIAILAVKF
jgi:hypothetical protein